MLRRPQHRRRGLRDLSGAALALLAVTVTLSACAATEEPDCADRAEEPGYRVLFDGSRSSLEQWQMTGPGTFELSSGCSMVTSGGMGLLWYPEEFEDYILTLDWAITDDDNSGVFVGFPDPEGDVWTAVNHGYEIQIDPSDSPERTTGSIYTFQGADIQARDQAVTRPVSGTPTGSSSGTVVSRSTSTARSSTTSPVTIRAEISAQVGSVCRTTASTMPCTSAMCGSSS